MPFLPPSFCVEEEKCCDVFGSPVTITYELTLCGLPVSGLSFQFIILLRLETDVKGKSDVAEKLEFTA